MPTGALGLGLGLLVLGRVPARGRDLDGALLARGEDLRFGTGASIVTYGRPLCVALAHVIL